MNNNLLDVQNLSVKFSVLKYSSKASWEEITPSDESNDAISDADDPWEIEISNTWYSGLFMPMLLVSFCSIESAKLLETEIPVKIDIVVITISKKVLLRR